MLDSIFPIKNIWLVIAIGVLSFVLSFISAKGGLTDDRYYWYKKITKRGWSVISIGVLVIMGLVLQECNNRFIEEKSASKLKNEQNTRENRITQGINKGVELSTRELFNNLSIAFKKQGLQYDSIKNQIIKLKDSIRKPNGTLIPPLMRVRNLEIKDSIKTLNKYTILYDIISDDAASYNTHVSFDIFGYTPELKVVAIDFNKPAILKGATIARGQSVSYFFKIIDNYHCNILVIRLKGFYFSSDKSKIKIDELYLLRKHNNTTSFELPVQFHENTIREYIKENNF